MKRCSDNACSGGNYNFNIQEDFMINTDTTITFFNGSLPLEIQDEIVSHIPGELLKFAQVNKEANKMVHDLLEKTVKELKIKNLACWDFCYKNEIIEDLNNFSLNKKFNSLNLLIKNCTFELNWSAYDWFANNNRPPLEMSLEDLPYDLLPTIASSLNKADKSALASTCKKNQEVIKDLFIRNMHIARRNLEHLTRQDHERFIVNFETMGLAADFSSEY